MKALKSTYLEETTNNRGRNRGTLDQNLIAGFFADFARRSESGPYLSQHAVQIRTLRSFTSDKPRQGIVATKCYSGTCDDKSEKYRGFHKIDLMFAATTLGLAARDIVDGFLEKLDAETRYSGPPRRPIECRQNEAFENVGRMLKQKS